MALNNHGVGAEGLLAAQSVLGGDPEMLGNDGRVEELWAMKAMEHAEVYFNLLCSVEPARLKLSGSQELDDKIYKDYKESFPNLDTGKLTEDDLKNKKAKVEWREFSNRYKDVEDFSLGSLLRMDSTKDYSEENTMLAIKIQFFAIEIARNRDGLNDTLRANFKPTNRAPKQKGKPGMTKGGVNMTEIEHELQQVLGGSHPLLS
eukprot:TRINITY_DN3869_c0_g1_i1.p1 TRINITY_DN3869_c0_g1~~TRINITY_DN3869_c0_g1_i1.p1  ORF type:complete len:214 (+),score=90.63 TRINITY_DN3869_c0_g1_i1:31-642(+)